MVIVILCPRFHVRVLPKKVPILLGHSVGHGSGRRQGGGVRHPRQLAEEHADDLLRDGRRGRLGAKNSNHPGNGRPHGAYRARKGHPG